MKLHLRQLVVALMSLAVFSAGAVNLAEVRFHDEANDTSRISAMLVDLKKRQLPTTGDMIAAVGESFLGTPYVGHTLESEPGEPEMLTINLDELDCTTFAETCIAMALTVFENRSSWRDFVYNLERIRYRCGRLDGYPSRLHYNCDWIVDNTYRGNLVEATRLFPKINYVVKSVDFMTKHRDRYPALADDENYEKILDVERGYRNHRFPYIKTVDLASKPTIAAMRNGDVVALTSTLKDLDVTHMGIIVIRDGVPYLMHASSSGGKVLISDVPLAEFMKRNRHFTGMRVIRIKE